MNKVILIGNLTKDPETRTTQSGITVVSFTVAVQRRYKDASGNYIADFINCVAWRKTAEFVAKYFLKGSKIGLTGNMQTRAYDDKNGVKRYVTEVMAEEVELVQGKAQTTNKVSDGELSDVQLLDDDAELPF
ncbi:MAG: single-stranded DNA-binding protein [Christensenella sp.]